METPLTRWDRWYRRTLPAYWVFLFCATHFPGLRIHGPVPHPDVLAHLVAFGLLAFLFWRFVESFGRPLSGRFVWIAALWLGAYATLDEYLQQFVNRGTDVWDWLANLVGVTSVLAVLEWRRRTRRPRADAQTTSTLDSPAEKT
jgi:VanZ family protein